MVDLIITDASMPCVNGLQLLTHIDEFLAHNRLEQNQGDVSHRIDLQRPVILMYCALNRKKIQKKAKNIKIDYLVEKPVHYKQLKYVLKTLGMVNSPLEDQED